MSDSEVARIRRQIEAEYEASQRVLSDFTPTARHAYVLQRQENIARYFEKLKQYMKPEEAIVVVLEATGGPTISHGDERSTS